MGNVRLSALSMLSIESDFVGKLNFSDIVSDFASVKEGTPSHMCGDAV